MCRSGPLLPQAGPQSQLRLSDSVVSCLAGCSICVAQIDDFCLIWF